MLIISFDLTLGESNPNKIKIPKKISKQLNRPKTTIPILPPSAKLLIFLKMVGMATISTNTDINNQQRIKGKTNSSKILLNVFIFFSLLHMNAVKIRVHNPGHCQDPYFIKNKQRNPDREHRDNIGRRENCGDN